MTRLLTEGFEAGDVTGLVGCISISGGGRSGSYSARLANAGLYQHWGYESDVDIDEFYSRWASRLNGYDSSPLFVWKNNGTILGYLKTVHSAGINRFQFYVGETMVQEGAGGLYSPTAFAELLELHVKISDVAGAIELKVNGIVVLSYYGDTKPDANTGADLIGFPGATGTYQFIDDIAINDTNGTVDNSWCGEGHIIALRPNAIGDNIDLMGSDENQVDNHLLVDDIPSDGDGTYVWGDTAETYDLYHVASPTLPPNTKIKRVWVEARAKDPDVGTLALLLKAGVTEAESDPLQLTTAYSKLLSSEYLLNPDDSLAWEEADLDSIQIGVRLK